MFANRFNTIAIPAAALFAFACGERATRAQESLPDSDIVMKACADEMSRAMTLQLEDLEKPYFIQLIVDDSINYSMTSSFGALTGSTRGRSRRAHCDVRVGDYKFDNSNFAGDGGFGFGGRRGRGGGGGGGGSSTTLPEDDDAIGIRQSLWALCDEEYKSAVETLTKKRAYVKDKQLTDRPDDFTKMEPRTHTDPTASMAFDRAAWEQNLTRITATFKRHPHIQDGGASLVAGLANSYILNNEGTRIRKGDTGILLTINADCQSEDGMRFSDSLTYVGEQPSDLPSIEKILADVENMAGQLADSMKAPILETYSGPVLFDGRAAALLFRNMLAGGVVGRVDPVGTQRRQMMGAEGLEKQLGLAILPKSFQVFDDPTQKKHDDTLLFGHYHTDDEGVAARRVDIVVNGVLKDMCMSRVPTKRLTGSNGHARQAGGGSPRASIGNLFIQDTKAISEKDLKDKLIEVAREAGLEYGIRVASLKGAGLGASRQDMIAMVMRRMRAGGGGGGLPDPARIYKVYVSDGREEMVRGCEFGQFETRTLKKIAAAGNTQYVHNGADLGGGVSSAIIAPAVLFEELEISKIEQEQDTLPIMKAPLVRDDKSAEKKAG